MVTNPGDEPTEAAPARQELLRRQLLWLAPIACATACLTWYLFAKGKVGVDYAAVLAFPLGVASVVTGVVGPRLAPLRGIRLSRRVRVVGIAAFVAAALVTTAGTYAAQREKSPTDYLAGTVRIGYVKLAGRGWSTSDGRGQQVGFEAELATALIRRFPGIERFEWVALDTLSDRIDALHGEWGGGHPPVDLVISQFAINAERQRAIDFAGPYFVDTQGMLAPTGVTHWQQVRPGTVCSPAGSSGERTLRVQGWNPVTAESTSKCFAKLQAGDVAAVSTGSVILHSFLADYPELKPKYHVLPITGATELVGIGIPNDRPKLCAALNEAISDFLETSWDQAFAANMAPLGVAAADHKPAATIPCERPGTWFKD